MSRRELTAAIAATAERHGGHISRRQLHRLGLTPDAIAQLIATGRIIRVYQGVYAVGHLPRHPHDRARGALLALGPRAALSHGSAACLWGAWRVWREPLELLTPLDRRRAGVRTHHAPWLARQDVTIEYGIRTTTPALTILHIADRFTARKALARAIDNLRLRDLLTLEALQAVVDRFPRHPGARQIRPLIDELHTEPTRSDWELDWIAFAAAHELPPHEMNVVIDGYRVDVRFLDAPVVVELDGWETHRTRRAFERDRHQDNELLDRQGIHVVRLTEPRLRAHGALEAARLQRLVARLVKPDAQR
jgi:hypothetical protein